MSGGWGGGGAAAGKKGARISWAAGGVLTDPATLPLDTEDYSDDPAFVANLASSALTVPAAGRYLVIASVNCGSNLAGNHIMSFAVANTGSPPNQPSLSVPVLAAASTGINAQIPTIVEFAGGELLTLGVLTDAQAMTFAGLLNWLELQEL